jgi:hypothetical protein
LNTKAEDENGMYTKREARASHGKGGALILVLFVNGLGLFTKLSNGLRLVANGSGLFNEPGTVY